jgi:hypothetical protein
VGGAPCPADPGVVVGVVAPGVATIGEGTWDMKSKVPESPAGSSRVPERARRLGGGATATARALERDDRGGDIVGISTPSST